MTAKKYTSSKTNTPTCNATKAPPAQDKAAIQQSLTVVQLQDALLKMRTVNQTVGMSASTVYRGVAAGTFPQPVRMGRRCTRWRAADIRAWIQAQEVTA